jgi:hypothetical protein
MHICPADIIAKTIFQKKIKKNYVKGQARRIAN